MPAFVPAANNVTLAEFELTVSADPAVLVLLLIVSVVTVVELFTSDSKFAGAVVPMPTLPLVVTYIPEPAVEFAWNLASKPVVAAPVLETFSKPLVEFRLALDEVRFNKLPVVKAFEVIVIGF